MLNVMQSTENGKINKLTESSQFCRLYVFVVFDKDMARNATDKWIRLRVSENLCRRHHLV